MKENLSKSALCQLLPHADSMCLIDQVMSWDNNNLTAQSKSHLSPDNPLSKDGSISSIIGVEYAAQTMAIHAALLYSQNSHLKQKKSGGYLATIRNIKIDSDFLYSAQAAPQNSHQQALIISVTLLMSDIQGYSYTFTISSNHLELLSGQLTLFLV